MRDLSYEETLPGEDLRMTVWCLWSFDVPDSLPAPVVHHFPPDGAVSVVARLDRPWAALVGPQLESPKLPPFESGTRMRGLRLWPGASLALELEPVTLRNRVEPITEGKHPDALVRLGRLLGDGLVTIPDIESALRRGLLRIDLLDRRVMRSVFELFAAEGRAGAADLAAGVGLSPRQHRRRFRRAAGLSPKELARIVRARSAAIAAILGDVAWTEAAAGAGFSDQAHLTRELARLSGLSPGRLGRYARRIRHRVISGPDGRYLQDPDAEDG